MIVTIEGDVRGTKALTKKGDDGKYIPVLDKNKKKLFIHRLEVAASEFGLPEYVDVTSSTDTKKKGPCSIRIDLRVDRDKDGKPTGKFRGWEI